MTPAGSSQVSSTLSWPEWIDRNGFTDLFAFDSRSKHPFENLPWTPSAADCAAAWQLLTELRTRIATQPLPHNSGDEATALKSVYDLFEFTRTAIKANPGSTHFASLSVWVLNQHVRPFTAKWHKWSVEGKLASSDVRFEFREELAELQPKLRELTRLLAVLSNDPTFRAHGLVPPQPTVAPHLWTPVNFGIGSGMAGIDEIRVDLNKAEADEVSKRRRFYKLGDSEPGVDAVGIALSGGGIRSATFSLGVLQHLARKGILRQVDFLSTVSGGGYIGGFLSSFLNVPDTNLNPDAKALPFGADGDTESMGVRQLRNHSKYLAEGGIRTLATIVSLVGYGLLVSALMLAPFLLAGVWLTVAKAAPEFEQGDELYGLPFVLGAAGVLAGCVLFLPIAQRIASFRQFWERACVFLGVVVAFIALFRFLPCLFVQVRDNAEPLAAAALSFFVTAGSTAVSMGLARRLARAALVLVVVVGPLLLLAVYFLLLDAFLDMPRDAAVTWLCWLTLAFAVYAAFVLDINTASPHPYYRSRLARTYLVQPDKSTGGITWPVPRTRLSELNSTGAAPYHLVNCALNVPASTKPELRGRNADFFFFSKHYCGGPIATCRKTELWEAADPQLNLATAVAISAAAAAPNMGTSSFARFRFLIALLNIRLGYWLRTPVGEGPAWMGWFRVPGILYYMRELLGQINERSAYLNLSDGGHIENLGVYELLRRRCKFVIAVDGEADPTRSFGGLLTLTQFAKIDLNVTIEPNLSDLRVDATGTGRAHFGLARIDYPKNDKGVVEHGLLLYIKSSLTGNESEFLKKFHREHPDFPHQSTAQQLYSETQFEAYRELGEHVARDLFRRDLVGNWRTDTSVREWFTRLWNKF